MIAKEDAIHALFSDSDSESNEFLGFSDEHSTDDDEPVPSTAKKARKETDSPGWDMEQWKLATRCCKSYPDLLLING